MTNEDSRANHEDDAEGYIAQAREIGRNLLVRKRTGEDAYDALLGPMPVAGSATGARWLAEGSTSSEAARRGLEILQRETAVD